MVCKKPGAPDDELLRLHTDYIGEVSAEAIKEGFFEVSSVDSSRFDRETMLFNSGPVSILLPIDILSSLCYITADAALHVIALETWLSDKACFEIDWETLRGQLKKVARNSHPKRNVDVTKDVFRRCRALEAHWQDP